MTENIREKCAEQEERRKIRLGKSEDAQEECMQAQFEDDIKQLRMIQRACRRIGSEYAEFQEGDSD